MISHLIRRPIAVTMAAIAVMVLGGIAAGLLPIGLMPAVDIPVITIRINAPNTTARELNASTLQPLRNQLMQTSHLKEIRTEAKDGSGLITMNFEYGKDIDYIFIDVNERVDRAMGYLPKSIDRPSVVKASATDLPAFYLNVSYKQGGDMLDLSNFGQGVIAKRLEQMAPVAFVDISGQTFPELVIEPDVEKIEALGSSVSVIENAMKANNLNLGNLTIRDGQFQYNIRFSSAITNKSDIQNIKINISDRIYNLSDLANVRIQPQAKSGMVVSDGAESLTMAVIKQSDARMDVLQNEFANLLNNFEKEYPNLKFTLTRDQTELLDYSISNMMQNLLAGAFLAILVLFLFMQDLRTPFLIAITIPTSMIVSILMFYLIGITINIISLSGLLLGLGMMVDNSIIVIDNITQRWDRGESLFDAVTKGTGEVFAPLLSSVMTTCAIFIPLVFMNGMAGAMFYDQAMAVSIGLVSSLVVGVTLIPVYYYLLYKKSDSMKKNRYLAKITFLNFEKTYEKGLRWTFRNQKTVWILMISMILGSVIIYNIIDKRTIPPMKKSDALLYINWSDQITAQENSDRTAGMLASLRGIKQYTSMVGQQHFMLSHTQDLSKNETLVYLKGDQIEKLTGEAQNYLKMNYHNSSSQIREAGNIFDMIFSDSEPPLLARLRAVSGQPAEPDKLNPILGEISANLPNTYLEPVQWQENITLYAKTELLTLYGITYPNLFNVLRSAFNENKILEINEGQYSLPVKIGAQENTITEIINTTNIFNNQGVAIPIRTLINESHTRDLKKITSGPEGDYYPLAMDIKSEQAAEVMATIKEVVNKNSDFEVSFSGSYLNDKTTRGQMVIILIVSVLLLYFILAAQFESLIQPFIIMSEIVVDIFGALFLLWICGSSINIMSMIGIIIMCGIVINDSILKVDTFNKLRKQGYSTLRAVILGGHRRIKPIIMTALTTILAIVPFLFAGGMGNDLERPMSLALIGGMIVGTIVSVYFIPLAYYYVYRHK